MEEFYFYANTGNICLRILTLVYYCIFFIAVLTTGIFLVLFVCLKKQGNLIQIMHFLWNVLRFFIVSFFLYGTAYGIFNILLADLVTYLDFVFGPENLNKEHYLLPNGNGTEYLKFCLLGNETNYKSNNVLTASLNDFFTNYKEFTNIKDSNFDFSNGIKKELEEMIKSMKYNINELNKTLNLVNYDELAERAVSKEGLFGSFDCGFLKSDLQHLYRTIYDSSIESEILCALCLCSSFFGEIVVNLLLSIMHHYNNEIFFLRGKNIFFGLEGFQEKKRKEKMTQDIKRGNYKLK